MSKHNAVNEVINDIIGSLINSKEFVNIFIENTPYKTDEDRSDVFEDVVEYTAKKILDVL